MKASDMTGYEKVTVDQWKAKKAGKESEIMRTFTLNGLTYHADEETLKVLRGIMSRAKATGDGSAVQAMISLGIKTGRICRTNV